MGRGKGKGEWERGMGRGKEGKKFIPEKPYHPTRITNTRIFWTVPTEKYT